LSSSSAARLLEALSAFGFPPTNLRPEQVIEPTRNIQMGVEPVQIHVMSNVSGVTWEEAWAGRVEARCGSHDLSFIGRGEFIRNKRAAGRLKDLADIEAIGG
jgi:hypothetical protein